MAYVGELSLFVALALLFYSPIVLGLRTFPDGDFTHHFLPFSLFQRQEFLAGRLPLWNPYTYSGHPFLADIQAAVFYPVSNLLLLLTLPLADVGQRMYVLQLEAIVHVALAGWFTALLATELTGNRWAGRTAGVLFAFSGYLTGYPPLQLAILRTAVWLPLILYFLHRAFVMLYPTSNPSYSIQLRWWSFASLSYATAFLAGHPQTFLHISYVVGAWCVVRGAWCVIDHRSNHASPTHPSSLTPPPSPLPKLIASTLTFFLLAIALSAAQLLPSIEFTRLSVRADTSYDFVSGGFPLQDSWQLLLPGVLTQFSPLYIGVVGLGLVIVGTGAWVLRKSDHAWTSRDNSQFAIRNSQFSLPFFLLLVPIALLLSFGRNAFLYPLFYQIAPGWSLFRGQERAAFLVTFGLSIVAAYGVAAIAALSPAWRRRLMLWACTAMIAGVYAFGLLWQLQKKSAVTDWAFLISAAISVVLIVGLGLLGWPNGWTSRRSWLLIGVMIANLFWANVTTNLTQFGPTRKTILAPEMEALGKAVTERKPADSGLPGRVYNEYRVYEDYGMRQQIEDVWGSSPLRLATYATLVEQLPLDRLWQLTGVEHVLTWRRDLDVASDRLAEFPQATDTTYLHRLRTVQPRVWLASAWQISEDSLTNQRLASATFNVNTTALLSVDRKVESGYTAPGRFLARSFRTAPNQINLVVESEKGGILIVSENWMPGWKLSNLTCGTSECPAQPSPVDSLPAFTIVRTNLTFIGVVVPAGEYQFQLVYQPPSVRFGLMSSATTLLLILSVGLWRTRRRIR